MSASELVRSFQGVDARTVEFVLQCPPRFKCTACGVIHAAIKKALCGHGFCPPCSKPTENNPGVTTVCPVDGKTFHSDELVPDSHLSSVLDLDVYCLNRRRGCQKTLPLKSLQGHTRSCGYQVVLCPYECGQQVCRRSLADHLKDNCERRLLPCQYCKEEVPHKETQEHLEVCGERPVICHFCKTHLTKHQMSDHEMVCSQRPRQCVLAQIGCEFKGNPTLLKVHEDNVKDHLQVLVTAIMSNQLTLQKVAGKMRELSKQVMQLQDEVKVLSDRLDKESTRVQPKILVNHGDSGRSSPATSDTSRGTKYSAPPTSL